MPKRTKQLTRQPTPAPPAPRPTVSPRLALLCSLAVALAVLLVYLSTIIPTAVDQDSGELTAAAHTLGIAHPTGYPLWTMLGRLFDLLPLGHTSAYRVALASAVPAAAAAGILCWLAITFTGMLLPGIFAGLAFGLWDPTWTQAVLAEVYGLSGFLFSVFLVALWKWSRARDARHLSWLALAGGAVAMHHRTAFLSVAPVLAMAAWFTPRRTPKVWATAALLFLAPFLCYLYLPLRAAAHPAVNWTDPVTFDRFYAHAMGTQYTHFALQNSFEEAMKQAAKLLGESLAGGIGLPPPGADPFAYPESALFGGPASRPALSVLLLLVGAPLILWGWWSWYRRQRWEALSLAAGAVVLSVWVVEWGETTDLKVFLLPLGALLALCGGLGLAQVRAKLSGLRGHLAVMGLGLLVTVVLFGANWSRADRRNQWAHRDRWYTMLSQLDKNAIFISDFDVPSFDTIYLQNVEGFRQDVTLLRTVGMMQPWYVNLIADPELRQVADQSWQRVSQTFRITGSGSPEFNQGTAVFAALLAQYYQNRRPVYALHGPFMPTRQPPYFLGLSEDLVRVTFAPPTLTPVSVGAQRPLAAFPGGVELVSLSLPDKADTGQVVRFTARWRVASSPMKAYFALALSGVKPTAQWQQDTAWTGRFVQSYPLLYARTDLPPSPPGTAYEQQGSFIIPSNANGGPLGSVATTPYGLWIAYSDTYPPQFTDWTQVAQITTHFQPYPTNGP